MRLINKIALTFYVVVLFYNNVLAQNNTAVLDSLKIEISEYVNDLMKKKKIVGVSFALVDDQEIVWTEGFGYSDKEKEIKATPKTVYLTCSMSKVFTASSVMQLAGDGKIDIDKPIQTYIPQFNIKSRFDKPGIITTRNVLTHHSGLLTDILYKFIADDPPPFTSVVDLLNEEYTCTQPNTLFSYSNEGYALLGVLVEKAGGKAFYDYTQKHLLKPLDMNTSSFILTPDIQSLYSKAYVDGKEFEMPLIRPVPAGQLYSNVLDISNFIKMNFNEGNYNNNPIVKSEVIKEMQTPQNEGYPLDVGSEMGLSWFLHDNVWGYGGEYCEHGGDLAGFHTQLALLTEHKIGVVVMTNTDKGTMAVRKISEKLLQKYLELKKGITAPENIETDPNKTSSNIPLDSAAGAYATGIGFIKFQSKNGSLKAKTPMGKLVLTPDDYGLYSTKVILAGLIPIKIGMKLFFRRIDNEDYVFYKNVSRQWNAGGKKTYKTPIPEIWKNRMGKYENYNEDLKFSQIESFELYVKKGHLYAKTRSGKDKSKFVFKIINNEQVVIDGIGRYTGNTVYFREDEVYWGGIKLRKINKY